MLHTLELDVEKVPWQLPLELVNSLKGIISINMIHVTNSNRTIELF